jgi:hypothetical protein
MLSCSLMAIVEVIAKPIVTHAPVHFVVLVIRIRR